MATLGPEPADTRIGLIIVHAAYGMPAQILILRGFMTTIPREIEKAAFLEGATDFQVFWKVILPLSVPGSWWALRSTSSPSGRSCSGWCSSIPRRTSR
jgi:ABC-type maltose transport system permease subunit